MLDLFFILKSSKSLNPPLIIQSYWIFQFISINQCSTYMHAAWKMEECNEVWCLLWSLVGGMLILRRKELKPKTFAPQTPVMHSTEFILLVFFSPRKAFINWVRHKGNDGSNGFCKPILLMHSIIEWECSVILIRSLML